MTEIISALFAALFGAFAIVMSVAFFRVLRGGPGKVAYLRRKQFGLRTWAIGGLPKMTRGTTVHELEGIELKARGGRLYHVRQTRAPTSEV